MGGSEASVLLDLLRSLLPHGVAVAGGPIGSHESSPFEIEERTLGRAVPKRAEEFRAGRAYARAALGALGLKPCGIPVGQHRQPVWPPGIVGSITHSDKLSFAIVARCVDFHGVGIDIEPDTALDRDIVSLICRPEEREAASSDGIGSVDNAKLFFVVKEAFFKAYFPVTGAFLEFQDVSVTIDRHSQSFQVRLVEPSKPALAAKRAFWGHFGQRCGHLVAVLTIPL